MARSISSAMHAILALARNDLRLLARRRGDLFFTFGWPLIVAIFFGMLFAGPGEGRSALGIALVDEDGIGAERLGGLDGRLRHGLDAGAEDLAVVAGVVERQGKQVASVILKPGFGAAAGRPFFGTPPQVEIGADPSRKAETALLEGLLHQAAAQSLQRTLQDPEAMQKMIRQARSGLLFGPAEEGAPHQGLGVPQYIWASSPLRRYADLVNQRQWLSLVRIEAPAYPPRDERLLVILRDFELAYDAYAEFQRGMERYWCLRWLIQEGIVLSGAEVLREELVRIDRIPLVVRVPSMPPSAPGSRLELALSEIDLLELTLHCEFKRALEAQSR